MEIHEIPVTMGIFPPPLQAVLAEEGATTRKMAIARAALPMPPAQLVSALAVLTRDSDAEVREAARRTLFEMPENTVLPVLTDRQTDGGVLDRVARLFKDNQNVLVKLVLNRATPNDTLTWMARHGEGQVLEVIAQNQARVAAHPDIVQGIYFNPKAKMSTVSRVLEFAVREQLPIQHMAGYQEIVASILGDATLDRPQSGAEAEAAVARQQQAEAEASEPEEEQPSASPENLLDAALDEGRLDEPAEGDDLLGAEADLFDELLGGAEYTGDDWGEFTSENTSPGLADEDDDVFFSVLSAAMSEEGAENEEERSSVFIADKIRDMNVSERVRLALMGNSSAREVLIRDPNKLVSRAVLRNNGINEREIASYAANRNLAADILRLICNSREWTRPYTTKMSLIENPKTPTSFAIQFLRHLREKDLKMVSKNRDVPPVVARMAARILDEREKKRKKK